MESTQKSTFKSAFQVLRLPRVRTNDLTKKRPSREQVDMAMTYAVLADVAASVTELKKDPMGTIREGGGETVVILNRNEPAFYAVPPARYEAMLEMIDDLRLAEIVRARAGEPTVRVDIDDLIAQAGGAD